jgi:hypothetical protein
MKQYVIASIGAVLLLPAFAAGQTATAVVAPAQAGERATAEVRALAGKLSATVESRTTTGRPYSAEAVTESFHALADGNRIQNRNVTRIYRDSDGRTRREIIGAAGTAKTITISDPIARTNFTLEPETRVAYGAPGLVMLPSKISGTYAVTTADSTAVRAKVEEERQRSTAATVTSGGRGGGGAVMARGGLIRTPAGNEQNVIREELGTQTIEGVAAAGTRTTTVIPAGAIGNLQEIRIVSEQWFSPDLQVLVMTKHSDPRSGETTYKLTNIVRAEPDPALFIVPADYTVKGRTVKQPQ